MEAKNNDNMDKYNEYMDEAIKEENKINIIHKADELIHSANDALASNDNNKADYLIKEAVKLYESLNEWNNLKNLVLKGIGFHHAGMIPLLKEIVEYPIM
jgi:replicative superfamily II helicase